MYIDVSRRVRYQISYEYSNMSVGYKDVDHVSIITY